MSKDQITLEQALEAAALCKDTVRAAKADLKAFRKEHNLKPDDEPGEEKVAKALGKLNKKLATAEEELEKANEVAKGLKPVKNRVSSYEYPADCITAGDKKKFRAKARRDKKSAAKAADKAAAAPAAAEEAPATEGKKKKRKSEEAPESED